MEPIVVRVDSRVRVPVVGQPVAEAIRAAFEHDNPGFPDEGPPVERTWEEDGQDLLLPRGGMGRVRAVLRASGIDFKVFDQRQPGDYALLDDDWGGAIPAHRVELWDFQERIVRAILSKQNCIVLSGTGTGKTTAALAAIARIGRPALVIVNTGGLHDQWRQRAAKELGVPIEKIGVIGGGHKPRTAPVTVAMQQTLARGIDPKWLATFGVVVCDEVDIFAAPTFVAATTPWPAQYRVGVTATLERHDGRDYLVRDLFGDVVAEVTRDEAIAKGRIVEVEIRVVPTDFESPSYKYAAMSGNKFRLFAAHKKMLAAMWASVPRNDLVWPIVQRHVDQGDQVMVLSSRRDHCKAMDARFRAMGIDSGMMLGGDRDKFDATRDAILAGRKQVVVGTEKAIGRGQDFPAIAVGVATMPIAGNKTLTSQVVGRLCRACEVQGKSGGILYVLVDVHISARKPIENLVRWFGDVLVRAPDGGWRAAEDYLAGLRGITRRRGAGRPTSLTGDD